MSSDSPDIPARRPRRLRRAIAWTVAAIAALVLIGAVSIVIWSQVGVMAAEPAPLDEVTQNPAIAYTDTSAAIVMSPVEGGSGDGLVFIPGAKVDAEAYASTLSGLVSESGMTVVITRPWLNLAFFDLRSLESFTDRAPDIDRWAVGGHSLGGVRSCQLAADADALVLFASYCAADLSAADIPVLSISGSEDGLSTPEKIRDAASLLPGDAEFVDIPGAAHASFGNYGEQAGDGVATVDSRQVSADITALVTELFEH
ncbi:alpha/beta hydrolase [Microbacterium amylolyticum]|uniref:Pimeloyl-ACP methyl ester carboxylesterase n=1 Tax=Microbacterium amylolyticum TaxID=936337 RepID=A0ABS4ZH16_9MICO|nr:alpha/beta hydrolase [Microbacterium amylolyticum]MBP2436338.1 pimeloyl-ACP methyl ester carboxylesterase [Microbacterium amylolyticum]